MNIHSVIAVLWLLLLNYGSIPAALLAAGRGYEIKIHLTRRTSRYNSLAKNIEKEQNVYVALPCRRFKIDVHVEAGKRKGE